MAVGALIPIAKLVRCEIGPLVFAGSSRMGNSGNSLRVQSGPSKWRLTVQTERLTLADARTWSVWLNDRLHRGETFTAFNLFRVNPAGALGTADGSIGLTVDIPNSELDLTGCGAYVASVGDFISYRTAANGYYCGEIREAATASGGNVTVKVSPQPLPKHASAHAVRRVQALAEFDAPTDLPPFEDYVGRSLAFEAMQVIRD